MSKGEEKLVNSYMDKIIEIKNVFLDNGFEYNLKEILQYKNTHLRCHINYDSLGIRIYLYDYLPFFRKNYMNDDIIDYDYIFQKIGEFYPSVYRRYKIKKFLDENRRNS
jgi:hypothetical protein